ncbi:uncharacterized protein LOC123268822 isoform X2 [Cotesia glomerata]|uniref:uncharacterized protein LOC123268822 isoform X2 n=1 Tax=Cotesia glomerata TaxID=32391 RepID=UPI001D028A45|nr:uncharacterized protein LOC123268822 isoform X2 [Cotesia glomerata]
MLPATSKSSRRSSILKLPKKSNSQNAESNSSEENSPTKQLKRRVSFAEKKSVKEFADSIEQGTVWDSTYEESDSSQIRMSHSEYTKSLVIQTSTNITYQSSQIQEDTRLSLMVRPEIEFKFPTESCAPRISHVDPEMLANKENMPEILGLETVESSFVEVEDVPVQASGFAVYCDEENFNETNTEDVPMECTIVADALVHVSADAEERDKTQIFGNESIEFTEVVPSKAIRSNLGNEAPLMFDKSMEITEAVPSLLRSAERTVFHDGSMELTEAVPRTNLPNLRSAGDRTQVFHDKSMELTEAVPRTNLLTIGTEVFNNRFMELTEAVPRTNFRSAVDKTQVFLDKSMELTEAVPRTNLLAIRSAVDGTEVFNNRSEAVPRTNLPNLRSAGDRTQVFYDKSMELTEAVPRTNLLTIGTEVFNNRSMELTEAVPRTNFRSTVDKTQVFHDKSMEITEAVPRTNLPNFRSAGDRTQVFHDKSMELTESIPRTNLLTIRSAIDGTEVFNNRSMKLTEAVPNLKAHFSNDRTQVFHNKSMELTEAFPRTNLLNFKSPDRTQVFHDKSMELTEAVPRTNLLHKVLEDRTEFFQNKSMELTEAICPRTKLPYKVPEDTTEYFQNQSMERTEAVPRTSLLNFKSADRTQVFHDKSMELTEAVPRTNLLHKVLEDRTEVFQNKSMELTEAICPRTKLPYKVPDDKTEFFHNQSMEQTEAICSRTNLLPKVPGDKTEGFHNKSMELTEVIAPNLRPINEDDLKFHHESLKRSDAEITQTINPRDQDQNIHHNYFMENTVSINPSLKRSYKCIADPRTPRSVISSPNPKNPRDCPVDRKASMDMLHRILHQGLENMPDVPELPKYDSLEESMEMTVAIPSLTNRSEITVSDLTEDCDVAASFGSGGVVERHDNLEEISVLNTKETFVEFDDNMQGNDIGTTSVFLEQTPSFMYTSDLDLDGHVIRDSVLDLEHQDLEQQDLKHKDLEQDREQQDLEQGIKQRDLEQNLEQQDLSQVLEQDREQQDLEQDWEQRYLEQGMEQRDQEQGMEQPDLEQDMEQQDLEQGMEQQDLEQYLEQGMEQQENYNAIEYINSKLKESDIRSIFTGDLSGTSLKRSILDDEEEQINRKKFIYKQNLNKNERQELMMEEYHECSEENVIEKVHLPEIGNVEKSEISLRLKKLIFRDEMVNRKLKASRLDEFRRLKVKTLEIGTKKQSESKTRFDILKEGLEEYAKSRSCLWKIHTIHPEVICIEFRKTALMLAVKIEVRTEERISKICVVPRVNDADSEMLRMTDRLIVRAIDCDKMADYYLTYADVPKLIADVTEKVHFVYDFYDEMVKLWRVNLMELDGDIVTVTVRTKKMETIIKLIINIARYPSVTPEDIKIVPILGTVKEDVKKLIKNLKPSPKLLTLYITDVYEFLELLAFANSKN